VSLLEDLRAAAPTIDQQFLPTSNELVGVVAGLALQLEHGDAFLNAAKQGGTQGVTDLIAGAGQQAEPTPEESDEQAAHAARHATAHQTKVEHEPGKGKSGKGKD
jgi:hypothetical protein